MRLFRLYATSCLASGWQKVRKDFVLPLVAKTFRFLQQPHLGRLFAAIRAVKIVREKIV